MPYKPMDNAEKEASARLGRNIRHAREALNLQPEQLAAFANVSLAYVRKLEGGNVRKPDVDKLRAVAKVLGQSIESLYADRPQPTDWDNLPVVFCYVHPGLEAPISVCEEVARLATRASAQYRSRCKRRPTKSTKTLQ